MCEKTLFKKLNEYFSFILIFFSKKLELSIETFALFISLPWKIKLVTCLCFISEKKKFFQEVKKKRNQKQILRFICQLGKHNNNVKEDYNKEK